MASEIRVNSLTNRSGLSTVSITDTGAVVAGLVTATTFSGPLTGAVTGNVTGDLTGNVTGNVTGNLTGDVTGNTSGTAGGLSGSPSITVTDITATGNVSIGGTLTYEDVTNIDSVGIVTAQSDVLVGRNLSVTSGISTFKTLDYAAIDSTISDTAVDVFIYDTSKDSDGGAWRKRTQHTSWYNETLNTATRGSRREFPAVAVLVLTSTNVIIYDGDDPDLPMWMDFTISFNNYAQGARMLGGVYGGANQSLTPTAITMMNGQMWMSRLGVYNGSAYYGAVNFVDFLQDLGGALADNFGNGVTVKNPTFLGNIAQRNSTFSSHGQYKYWSDGIVNSQCNDVAMTVLPNAPIDETTGLPIPTIAVATDGGVSVIRDDGTVKSVSHSYGGSMKIDVDGDVLLATHNGPTSGQSAETFDLTTLTQLGDGGSGPVHGDNAIGTDETYYGYGSIISGANYMPFVTPNHGTTVNPIVTGNDIFFGQSLLIHIEEDRSSPANGMTNYITSDYNTGWMHGDCKGAFLSDTTAESLTANTNLASNFVQGGTNRLTSETYDDGDTSWQMVDDAGSANGYVSIELRGLTIGQSYIISMTWDNNAALDAGYNHRISHLNGLAGENVTNFTHWNKTNASSETLTGVFVAQSVNDDDLVFYANAITLNVSNFIVRAVDDEDRSVNNNGLQVFGTVTKTAVATGAELVAYSGFDTSNYLLQPYNSDFEVGTGDFTHMLWYKGTGSAPTGSIGAREIFTRTAGTTNHWLLYKEYTNYFGFDSIYSPNTVQADVWYHVAVVRKSGVAYLYENGVLVNSAANSRNIADTSGGFMVGQDPANGDWRTRGYLSLVRFSTSTASPEQIKKIYEDEKMLFQENAKCTLYGSSDAVTALAYDDDTDLLHVGTSSGRSDFQGLRRINNTTTAVTTAITAQNEFIIEQ